MEVFPLPDKEKLRDPITEFMKGLKQKGKITAEELTQFMFILDKDIAMKTRIKNPLAYDKLKVMAKFYEKKGCTFSQSIYECIYDSNTAHMVSYQGKSREEFTKIMSALLVALTQNKTFEERTIKDRLLGR